MIIITDEESAVELAERYGPERCAFFSFSKSPKAVEVAGAKTAVLKMPLTPGEDGINAIKDGSVSRKKTIKKIKAALDEPSQKTAHISIAMCTMLRILKVKNKKGPNILFFVLDKTDSVRNKLLRDIVVAAFRKFGLAPTSKGDIKSVFKLRKKMSADKLQRRAARYEAEAKECQFSPKGIERHDKAMLFFEIENRFSAMTALKNVFTPEVAKASAKALVWSYTAENLRKVVDDSFGKKLAKRDKKAVKAYKSFRDIVESSKDLEDIDLPKVKFGQKRKKNGDIKGPKMNKKKFKNFFRRESNWGLLQILYAHTTVIRAGFDAGTDEYIKSMAGVCKAAGDIGDAFLKAAKKVA